MLKSILKNYNVSQFIFDTMNGSYRPLSYHKYIHRDTFQSQSPVPGMNGSWRSISILYISTSSSICTPHVGSPIGSDSPFSLTGQTGLASYLPCPIFWGFLSTPGTPTLFLPATLAFFPLLTHSPKLAREFWKTGICSISHLIKAFFQWSPNELEVINISFVGPRPQH